MPSKPPINTNRQNKVSVLTEKIKKHLNSDQENKFEPDFFNDIFKAFLNDSNINTNQMIKDAKVQQRVQDSSQRVQDSSQMVFEALINVCAEKDMAGPLFKELEKNNALNKFIRLLLANKAAISEILDNPHISSDIKEQIIYTALKNPNISISEKAELLNIALNSVENQGVNNINKVKLMEYVFKKDHEDHEDPKISALIPMVKYKRSTAELITQELKMLLALSILRQNLLDPNSDIRKLPELGDITKLEIGIKNHCMMSLEGIEGLFKNSKNKQVLDVIKQIRGNLNINRPSLTKAAGDLLITGLESSLVGAIDTEPNTLVQNIWGFFNKSEFKDSIANLMYDMEYKRRILLKVPSSGQINIEGQPAGNLMSVVFQRPMRYGMNLDEVIKQGNLFGLDQEASKSLGGSNSGFKDNATRCNNITIYVDLRIIFEKAGLQSAFFEDLVKKVGPEKMTDEDINKLIMLCIDEVKKSKPSLPSVVKRELADYMKINNIKMSDKLKLRLESRVNKKILKIKSLGHGLLTWFTRQSKNGNESRPSSAPSDASTTSTPPTPTTTPRESPIFKIEAGKIGAGKKPNGPKQ